MPCRRQRVFPGEGSAKREWAASLAVRGKGAQLARMCRRVAAKMEVGSARDKVATQSAAHEERLAFIEPSNTHPAKHSSALLALEIFYVKAK